VLDQLDLKLVELTDYLISSNESHALASELEFA
jgi:hypothetical protein